MAHAGPAGASVVRQRAGVIGLIPGETMQFLAGESQEVYDEDGVLQCVWPTLTGSPGRGTVVIEVAQTAHSLRFAGLMHEPDNRSGAVVMAGPMGMVKLFVRSGVRRCAAHTLHTATACAASCRARISPSLVHHANYKSASSRPSSSKGASASPCRGS